jgi:hypothetical protein
VLPDRRWRHLAVGREVFRALPRANDVEAAGAGPVDELADEGRLVTEGKAVGDPGRCGSLGQCRPREYIGLDIHHHEVAAEPDRLESVLDARRRCSRRLDDDLDTVARDQLGLGGRHGDFTIRESGAAERGAGALSRHVGDARDLEAAEPAGLGQDHRPERSRPDKRDPERPSNASAFVEELERPAPHRATITTRVPSRA